MREHGRLHTGAADLVDGGGAGRIRQPGAARSLARRSLPLSGGQYAAHEHLVDAVGCQICPLHGGADHVGSEVVGAERGEFALEPAQRSPCGGEDDDRIGSRHDSNSCSKP